MSQAQIRNIIRQHADARGCRYQIRQDGTVHYFGTMTNSREIGWYLKHSSAPEWAQDIIEGRA